MWYGETSPHPWGPEETLGVGRLQRYLKYKAAVKGGGRSKRDWDHGVRVGKKGGVTWEGWKPANEEGCSHREGVGSRTWVAGGARCGGDLSAQRPQWSKGDPSLPRKSHYCQDCHDLRTIGKGDGIQMGLQAVQTLSWSPSCYIQTRNVH